jgi:hypothetical protein
VIAATKKDLGKMLEEGEFREDLYYRLNVVPMHIPPLRERLEDMPLLVGFFLQRIATKLNRDTPSMTAAAVAKLQQYQWPGNIRQLEHLLEQVIAIGTKGEIDGGWTWLPSWRTSRSGWFGGPWRSREGTWRRPRGFWACRGPRCSTRWAGRRAARPHRRHDPDMRPIFVAVRRNFIIHSRGSLRRNADPSVVFSV